MSADESTSQGGQASMPRGPYVGIPREFDGREDFDSFFGG